jgi:hypothetical protein
MLIHEQNNNHLIPDHYTTFRSLQSPHLLRYIFFFPVLLL